MTNADLQYLMEKFRLTVEPADKMFEGSPQAWIARRGDIPAGDLTSSDCFYGRSPLDAVLKLVGTPADAARESVPDAD